MSLRSQVFDNGHVQDGIIYCDSGKIPIQDGDEMVVIVPPKREEPAFFFRPDDYDHDESGPIGKALKGTFRPKQGASDEFVLADPVVL